MVRIRAKREFWVPIPVKLGHGLMSGAQDCADLRCGRGEDKGEVVKSGWMSRRIRSEISLVLVLEMPASCESVMFMHSSGLWL